MKKIGIMMLVFALIFTLAGCSSGTGVPSLDDATKNLENAGYSVEYLDYKDNADILGEGLKAEKGDDFIVIIWYQNPDFKSQAGDFLGQFYLNAPCISSRDGVYYRATADAMTSAGITPIKIG